MLYLVHASSLQRFHPVLRLNAFTDDHSLKYAFKANNREQEIGAMNCIEQCVLSVNRWMNKKAQDEYR